MQHKDTFDVNHSNNQAKYNPVLPYGLKIAAAVSVVTIVTIYFCSLLGINVLQIDLIPVQLYRYFLNSEICLILHNANVIIFLIYFVLLHFVK